jgi:hypothetical protein
LIYIAIKIPKDQQNEAISEISQRIPEEDKQRFDRARTQIFPKLIKQNHEEERAREEAEQARLQIEAFQRKERFLVEHAARQAKIEAETSRRRRSYIAIFFASSTFLLTAAGAYRYRSRIASFLRERQQARREAAAVLTTAEIPTAPTMPAQYPAVWQAGYMNRAYQFAAWCYASLWFLLALPLVLMVAIPALTILLDFSTDGMRAAAENVKGFATGFRDNWGQLWFGLLLLAFTGFSAFKIYGRYTLPKPFRPKIRVVRTTIRVVFLVTTTVSVGTFFMYFSEQAGEIYQNPLVRMAIEYLRDLLGV